MLKWQRPARPVTLCSSVLLLSLGACGTLTRTAGISNPAPATTPASACSAFSRISFSRLHDTPETIVQVKAYDAARDALCGKGK